MTSKVKLILFAPPPQFLTLQVFGPSLQVVVITTSQLQIPQRVQSFAGLQG